MVTDYEAAWIELQAFIASKPQHGRDGTLVKMAELAAAHRVPSGELPRLLRLYGVEVARAETETNPADDPDCDREHLAVGSASSRDIIDRGGHDGSNGSHGARNGRRIV